MRLRGFLLVPIVGLAGLIAVAGSGGSVSAHTGFESSTPADGETIDAPVFEIVITFTGEATPVGEGFSVLDPSGVIRAPTSVSTVDDKVFVLGFDPPLVGGDVGVRWNVQAQDAHPISGSFTFTVTASAPPTSSPGTSAPPTSEPSVGTSTTESELVATATTAPSAPAPTPTSLSAVTSASDSGTGGGGTSLEEFLAVDTSRPGESRQLLGRIVGLLGVVGALGGLAFLALTFRGTLRETSEALVAVAVLGLVVGVGALLEYWGTITQDGESFWGAFTSTPGSAMALRFVGGVVLAVGAVAAASRSGRARVGRSLSAAVAEDTAPVAAVDASGRWSVGGAPLTMLGAAVITASFWFDGHTVTEGPRLVHAAVNSVHVVAASIWAGGVVALAATLWIRHRRDEVSRAAELIVRFSTVAVASLVAVAGAGVLMAVFVLDSFGELTSTEWGKTLLIKTGAVGLAALGGAYNHFRLRPALEAAPDDPDLVSEFRRTLVAESILLIFVTVTTAWLIAAAT